MEAAVTRAKTMGLARFYHPSHGRSALRFGHTLDEALGLDTPRLALVAVLMLRGPQTVAELRARTQRMAEFADTGAVEAELEALGRFEPPSSGVSVASPGRKRTATSNSWAGRGRRPGPPPSEPESDPWRTRCRPRARHTITTPVHSSVSASGTGVGRRVAALRAEVDALRRDVDDLRSQLGV